MAGDLASCRLEDAPNRPGGESVEDRLILVIDGDRDRRRLVNETLRTHDFAVRSADGGPSGIAMAKATRPAVILLDMAVSGIDCLAACALLKQDPLLKGTAVVAITESPDLRYTEQAFRAGVDLFLAPPFPAPTLIAVTEFAAELARCGIAARRCHSRLPREIPVRCLFRDAETTRKVVGSTGNMSPGGLLLKLPARLLPGIVFRLQLRLPEVTVTAEGVHVWQRPQPCCDGQARHGVRLLRFVEDAGLVQYRRFLSQVAAPQTVRSRSAP